MTFWPVRRRRDAGATVIGPQIGMGTAQPPTQQGAQAGPQQPAPESQGQLQFLPLGQDQQFPQDQHLTDEDAGPIDQDRGLEPRQPEKIRINFL